jgi:mRNA (2'-O-methyladenosine-N6-)-methyltransferase
MDDRNQDTWSDLQAFKSRQNSLRVKLERRKKQREHIVSGFDTEPSGHKENSGAVLLSNHLDATIVVASNGEEEAERESRLTADHRLSNGISIGQIEGKLLQCLCDAALNLPLDSRLLLSGIRKTIEGIEKTDHSVIVNLLEKFAHQGLIGVIKDSFTTDGETCMIVSSADHSKLIQFAEQPFANGDTIVPKDCIKSK